MPKITQQALPLYFLKGVIVACSIALLYLPLHSQARELQIGVGNFEPFFEEKDERGLFMELTREIFSLLPQYNISFVFMSNHRLLFEIREGNKLDVACNIFARSESNAFLSLPVYRYKDVAISKRNDKLSITSISDLGNYSIAAYQGAKKLLGHDFEAMASSNRYYSEHALPSDTTMRLVSGESEVRIGDYYIFLNDIEHRRHKQRGVKLSDYEIHPLWPMVFSHMAFKDENLRDEVNEAIQILLDNGSIDQIYRRFELEHGVDQPPNFPTGRH